MAGDRAGIRWGFAEAGGVRVHVRSTDGSDPASAGKPPTVYVHGVPAHSEEWDEFLARSRGPALAYDLPGFGLSERPPPERFDGTMHAHAALFAELLDELGIGDYGLVVHDWGGLALSAAMREPDRVRRLCLVNTVPYLPGYRWHRIARQWRTPVLGELSTKLWTRGMAAVALREARADWSRQDPAFVDMIWSRLDRGTFDAILRLYRSAPEDELARIGAGPGGVEGLRAPALVVWGMKDRYLPGRFGRLYAEALPDAELIEVPDAGHWPWRERPELIGRIVGFMEAGGPA